MTAVKPANPLQMAPPSEPEVKLNVTPVDEPKDPQVVPSSVEVPKAKEAPDAVPDAVPEPSPAPTQPEPTPEELGIQDQASFIKKCVKIEPQAPGGRFAVRGVCTKCGWQSFQKLESDARALVENHALKHWSEVAVV